MISKFKLWFIIVCIGFILSISTLYCSKKHEIPQFKNNERVKQLDNKTEQNKDTTQTIKSDELLALYDPCKCEEEEPVSKQNRTDAKHITNYDSFSKVSFTITPDYIIDWEDLYSEITSTIGKKKTPRISGTPEDSLYIMDGYMYFVKQNKDDCDFHIEIGSEDITSKRRVIVEVTKENCVLQQKIYEYITLKGEKLKKQFKKGLHCTVEGLGFFDAANPPKEHGGEFTHKTSWELHPVKNIEFK